MPSIRSCVSASNFSAPEPSDIFSRIPEKAVFNCSAMAFKPCIFPPRFLTFCAASSSVCATSEKDCFILFAAYVATLSTFSISSDVPRLDFITLSSVVPYFCRFSDQFGFSQKLSGFCAFTLSIAAYNCSNVLFASAMS